MRIVFFVLAIFFAQLAKGQEFYLFAGTYTSGKSEGIYVYDFNASTGEAKPVSTIGNVQNPSYLALSPGGKNLYSVIENGGAQPGEVSAFAFNPSTGHLQFLNKQTTGGDGPCYVSVDKTGKWLAAGNYSGGNFSVLPILQDGSLGPIRQLINHTGKGFDKDHQEKAHVHAVVFSPDQHYLLTPDLGLDKVMLYGFNAAREKPLDTNAAIVQTKPGSGPRHITFHPLRPFAYLVEELSGTVSAYRYQNGHLFLLQNISSHPANYKGEKGSADIHVSPDGKFLYASNRGDANSIAIYIIEQSLGMLRLKGFQSTLGKTPRNFVIDPTGRYLLVANQDTDNVVIFKRNPETGLLQATGKQINIPNPVCLIMIKK